MSSMWWLWIGTSWAFFYQDSDGDGAPNFIDCQPYNPAVSPYAEEIPADGTDQDCDGRELCYIDNDRDGYGSTQLGSSASLDCSGDGFSTLDTDCDDTDAEVNPGAPEYVADGVDSNCTGLEICYDDDDGDAYGSTSTRTSSDVTCRASGVADNPDDCDDTDAGAYPGAPEVPEDGVDQDCNGSDLVGCYVDDDHDGFGTDTIDLLPYGCNVSGYSTESGDCDDTDAGISPDAAEVAADGVDQNCDGFELCYEDADDDGVGEDRASVLGDLSCSGTGVSDRDDDCDDGDASISPLAVEVACDGIDQDCDGLGDDDPDLDGDGFGACTDDCDDTDSGVNPGVSEVLCNLTDDDCDPSTPDGVDSDADGVSICAGDCNDSNPGISPLLEEVMCSGVDEDCDPFTPDAPDDDDDGTTVCDNDCDDDDPSVSPAFPEVPCNGVNDDCDPLTPDGCIDSADTALPIDTGLPTDTATDPGLTADTAPPQTVDTGTASTATTPTLPTSPTTTADTKVVEPSKPTYGFGCQAAPALPGWLGLLLLPLLGSRRR